MAKFHLKMKRVISFVLLFCISLPCVAQKENYAATLIDPILKENANAVIRLEQYNIDITSQKSMIVSQKRAVTVLNESGLEDIGAVVHYDPRNKVKKLSATVYDGLGKEIKSLKRKDFRDVSVADGVSVFNDNRMLYLDYTPVGYPFTMVFEAETETSNTAFIPSWTPLDGYYVSTEKSVINITYPKDMGFHYKEANFGQKPIHKSESELTVSYSADHLKALKGEESSPGFNEIAPVVYFRTDKFNLEGVDGEAKTWEEYGKWYYNSLLAGTDELPLETQIKIKALVGSEQNPLEIAKIVYKYVQDRTRYVSIQVGIGGFKPMLAKDVDKLGYGDCKALSNYTRALLKAVNVNAYNVLIYGGRKVNIQTDFVSQQGNHMILCIPDGDNYVWLECTDQQGPFGYSGHFTDNRDALVIKPDGGQIVHTVVYPDTQNTQVSHGSYVISPDGHISASVSIVSKGIQYSDAAKTASLSATEKDDFYKEYFDNINNLKFSRLNLVDDKKSISFAQDIQFSADGYCSVNGNRMMFVANVFNCNHRTPKRYRNRENPFEINYGFCDEDEIVIKLPEGYEVEAVPDVLETKTKYGEYTARFVKNSDNTITYKRRLLINSSRYDSKDYEDYRLFREQVFKNDNAKIVVTKK